MATTLTNLRYTNADQTCIVMDVQIDGHPILSSPHSFHYVPWDNEPVSLAVREALASGAHTIAPYVAPSGATTPEPAAGQFSVIAD